VVLSVAVVSVASCVALDLASRVTAARRRLRAMFWLLGGAVSMGSGIWAVRFIGMLAFELPVPVSYDRWMLALSLMRSELKPRRGAGANTRASGAKLVCF
jgi:NO-binding membrane sensor protein with MHYT domain